MKIKYLLAAILIAFIAAVAPFGAQQANAASIYDDTIQLQGEPLTLSYYGTNATDYTYQNLMSEFSTCAFADYTNYLIASKSPNGAVAITQNYSGSTPEAVWIFYSLTGKDTTTLQFSSGNGYTQLAFEELFTSDDIKAVQLNKNSSGDVQCITGYDYTNIFSVGGYVAYKSSSLNVKPYISQFNINFPPNYEGDDIPTSVPITYKPHIGWSIAQGQNNFKALNFGQEIELPTTADGFLKPKLSWELYKTSDDSLVDSSTTDQLEPYTYNLPIGEYYLIVKYVHPGIPYAPFDLTGITLQTVRFNINHNGQLKTGTSDDDEACTQNGGEIVCEENTIDTFNDCLLDEFPFVDLPGCISNINIYIRMLTFGTLFTGIEWRSGVGCYQLTVIGDWLNLNDKTVCENFPSHVKNAVSPFIAFGFGLIITTFIVKRGEHEV